MVSPVYLIDTTTFSAAIAPKPNPVVVDQLTLHTNIIATATPVTHELMRGYLRLLPSRRRSLIERFVTESVLTRLPILPYDRRAATWHAHERVRLERLGRTPPFIDSQR